MPLGPRQQGDLGEFSAIEWLGSIGALVFFPIGHSPDYDLVAEIDGRLTRVQVKTSRYVTPKGRFQVRLETRGGNQSWAGVAKRFSPSRCDYVFVLVADGRCWFIPSGEIGAAGSIRLGGPKYAEFEVSAGRPFADVAAVAR